MDEAPSMRQGDDAPSGRVAHRVARPRRSGPLSAASVVPLPLRRALRPAGVALVLACASGGGGGTAALDGSRWLLASYAAEGTPVAVPAEVRADARFAEGRVAGSSGCNAYQAGYSQSGARLTVGPVAATRRLCDGPQGEVEQAFLGNLGRAASFTVNPEHLTILDVDGHALLEFVAAPANPLVGSWHVTGYNNGRGGVVSVATGTELTVEFGENGLVSGSGGCNDYRGGYTSSGETLSVGALASTQRACAEATMAQEARFLAVLQTAVGYRLDPTGITLVLPDGSNGMVLAP